MSRRNVIAIGEAIHSVVEQALKKGAPVSNRRRRSAAQDEALRLRAEMATREAHKFSKKKSKALTDDSDMYMRETLDSDPVPTQAQNPDALMQLNQIGSSLTGQTIMEEITEDRQMGRLRPFVEGEAIGSCCNGRKTGPAPALKTHNDIMDDRQKELRERQQRNDRALDRMIERNR